MNDVAHLTPYTNMLSEMSDEQCQYCNFNNAKNYWWCKNEALWNGKNPCMKSDEFICPIAHNYEQECLI